jgi:hypothetical protein
MKQKAILLLVLLWLLLFGLSWAQCPEDPVDLGYCDTLHIFPWSWTDTFYVYGDTQCVNDPGDVFPCLFYVSLLVTHDSNTFLWESEQKWVQDSLARFLTPLGWTHTNPTKYCATPPYLNEPAANQYDPRYPRSVWRHFGGMENRVSWLASLYMDLQLCWDEFLMGDDYFWFGYTCEFWLPRWWEGERILFATLTFLVEDTMTVCIDSTLWAPNSHLTFWRHDAQTYCPRDNMPLYFKIFETGDVNANGTVDVGDQVYLYNYLFMGTSPPIPYEAGDLTQDGIVEVGDLIYLVNYLFISGPLPPVIVISPEGS